MATEIVTTSRRGMLGGLVAAAALPIAVSSAPNSGYLGLGADQPHGVDQAFVTTTLLGGNHCGSDDPLWCFNSHSLFLPLANSDTTTAEPPTFPVSTRCSTPLAL